jgi:uncharacterized protein (TIGR03067 family)
MHRVFAVFFALAFLVLLPASADDTAKDAEALKGMWKVTKAMRGGQPQPDVDKGVVLHFTEDELAPEIGGKKEKAAKYKLDPSKSPKQIDLMPMGAPESLKGIYELKGDTLKLCFARKGERPASFDATGEDIMYIEATKEKK